MGATGEAAFLDQLYTAAVNPSAWVPAMEALADLLGGTSSVLTRFSIVDGRGSSMVARIDDEMMPTYADQFVGRNPLDKVRDVPSYRRSWRPRILTDEDWMPKDDLLRSDFHHDLMAPRDIHSHLMIRLALEGDEASVLAIHRPRSRGQFEGRDLEVAAHYHHHLIRAFSLSRKVAADQALNGHLDAVFTGSAQGMFLVDRLGRILKLNAAAEAVVIGGRGLRVANSRLGAVTVESAQRLEALVAAAGCSDAGRRSAGSMTLRAVEGRAPISLAVSPLRGKGADVFQREPAVLVCVTDPEQGAAPSEQGLRELFGLTRMETRLALAFVEGQSLAQAAASLGVRLNTARAHLTNVFRKTGVNRQSALVALLMRSTGGA